MISAVYGTTVRIERNPLSGRPHVVFAAGDPLAVRYGISKEGP